MKSCAFFALYACTGVIAAASSPELPFTIVENRGQLESAARLVGQGPGFRAEFEDQSVLLEDGGGVARIDFPGVNPGTTVAAEQESGATINYLMGTDSSRWKTNLPAFRAARYANVWPGVDVVFYADGSHARAAFHLGAGSSVASIRLHFDGVPVPTPDGGLLIQTSAGEVALPAPEVVAENGALAEPLRASYMVRGGNTVSLAVASGLAARLSATSKNPPLLFSGYFGGSSQDNITAVAITTSFNIVVAGWTSSPDLPVAGARRTSGGGVDAFVANFSPVGGQLVYCTYLGGSGDDRAFGIAVDQAQNTYITGWTSSRNFPVVGGVQSRLSGARDAFVTKLNPTGTAIVYSTYLGGTGIDSAAAIALDATGAVVIIGDTTSTNLPATTGAYQQHLAGGQDVFVARLNPAGNAISMLTWLGGSASDHGAAVKIDPSGNIVVGGGTYSVDFPTTAGLQTVSGGGQDGFVSKLSPNGTAILWSTYLGGSGGSPGAPETVTGISLSAAGNPTVVGITSSADFPIRGAAPQPVFGGGQTDGFLARLTGNTSGLLTLSTFVGGSLDDGINAIAKDNLGLMYVVGYTSSSDFPIRRAAQSQPGGGMDAFVAKMDGSMRIIYSSWLGGSASDSGNAVAADSMTNVVVVGSTGSPDFPLAGGAMPRYKPGLLSGFVTKIGASWSTGTASLPTVYRDSWRINGFNGTTPAFTLNSFGQAGDIPVVGDWTGTGVNRLGVFRNGLWILDTNNNGVQDASDLTVNFGQAGDVPVFGFFDGTDRPQLGLFRAGTFVLDLSGHLTGIATGTADATFAFGQAGDTPITGDWNGSGTTKVGVFRSGVWRLDYDGDRAFTAADPTYIFGQAGDLPVVGDWNSAGDATKIGVYRAGYWILDNDGNGQIDKPGVRELYFAFGGPTLKPLVW